MKAVFFDIGETLINETRSWSELADWLEIPRLTMFAVLGRLIAEGRDHRELVEILRPDIGWNGVVDRFRNDDLPVYFREDLYADVRPALTQLQQQGYFVGVAGNQPIRREKDLHAMDLPADLIATSGGWGVKKPDQAFFAKVVSAAGCGPNEIVYVGDRVDNDVVPAAAVGLIPIHIVRGAWGYIQREWAGIAQARAQITSLLELPDLLARL